MQAIPPTSTNPNPAFRLADSEVPGLTLRIRQKGGASWLVAYTPKGSSLHRTHSLGLLADWPIEAARKEARRIRAQADTGVDEGERLATIAAERERAATARTVEDFGTQLFGSLTTPPDGSAAVWTPGTYVGRKQGRRAKDGSRKEFARVFKTLVVPVIGPRPVATLTSSDIRAVMARYPDTPVAANRAKAVCSILVGEAIRAGLRDELLPNPAAIVESNPVAHRDRALNAIEIRALWSKLAELVADETIPAVCAHVVKLLLLTGMRVGELLTAEWREVALDVRWLRLRDAKAGKRSVPLNRLALAELAALDGLRRGGHVVPGSGATGHLVGLRRMWLRVAERARFVRADGTLDVRLHDLRHTCGTNAARSGLSDSQIAFMLGHRLPSTTSKYINFEPIDGLAAADSYGEAFERVLSGGDFNPPPVPAPQRTARPKLRAVGTRMAKVGRTRR